MEDKEKRLTPIWGRRIAQSLSGTDRSRQDDRPRPFNSDRSNPNDEHSRKTHGQYHLWQRRPGKSRVSAAARHKDQSRWLWPREGDGLRLADCLAH